MSTNILRYYLNIRRWSEILMAYINYYFRVITAYVQCTKYVGFIDVSQVETKYYLPIRDNNRHTQRLSIKHMFQQFDKSKFLSELQRFKINMLVVLRRGFFMYGKRVYISSTQSRYTNIGAVVVCTGKIMNYLNDILCLIFWPFEHQKRRTSREVSCSTCKIYSQ